MIVCNHLFTIPKYGKFQSISQDHFVKHKLWHREECRYIRHAVRKWLKCFLHSFSMIGQVSIFLSCHRIEIFFLYKKVHWSKLGSHRPQQYIHYLPFLTNVIIFILNICIVYIVLSLLSTVNKILLLLFQFLRRQIAYNKFKM